MIIKNYKNAKRMKKEMKRGIKYRMTIMRR